MTRSRDLALSALLLAATAAYLAPFLNPGWQIYEDAAMLFRYAEHVSGGYGIVWNIGEPPVDGATDLLFMWIIAGLHWLGVGIEQAARSTSATAHLATVVLVYAGARRYAAAGPVAAALSAAFVAVGPGKAYVAGGFGTPVFALCVAITWLATLELVERPRMSAAIACAVASVVMGVARPEGAVLALLIVVSLLIYWRRDEARRFVWPIVITGGVLGGAYWLWRWSYFGYPLPNPYYRKGGGQIYIWNLLVTAKYGTLLLAPFLAPLAIGLTDRRRVRTTLLAAIPICGFLAAWMLLSNEMNFFRRFQYPIIGIAAMSWPLWISERARGQWQRSMHGGVASRAIAMMLIVIALAGTVWYEHEAYFPPRWQDELYQVGERLAPYQDRGYTLAISEAGLIPFYSKWNAIDVWGLNDTWIAHHGVVTASYLEPRRPEVVIFHAACVPAHPADPWEKMERAMVDYTREHGYVLSARGDNGAGWSVLYYVRPDFPDAAAINALLRQSVKSSAIPPTPLRQCSDAS